MASIKCILFIKKPNLDEELCKRAEKIVEQSEEKSIVLKLLMSRVRENDCEIKKIKKENHDLKKDLKLEKDLSAHVINEKINLQKKLEESEAKIEKVKLRFLPLTSFKIAYL